MHLATVNGEQLTQTLRRMAGAGAGRMGGAIWRVFYTLEIEWAGVCEELPAEVHEPITFGLLVANDAMHHVCGRFSYTGPTPISWAEGKLGIGKDLVPATQVDGPRAPQLPLDATEADLLRRLLTDPIEVIRGAGYTSECDDVVKRWQTSIAAAHKALAWTGIDERTLEAVAAQLVRRRSRLRRPAGADAPSRLDQPRCAIFFSDAVLFNTAAYHDPMSLLLAMLGEVLSDPAERTREVLSLLPVLREHPGGLSILAAYAATQKHDSPDLLHALFDLARELGSVAVLDPWLEKAVALQVDHGLLVDLLDMLARSADRIQLSARDSAHTWEALPRWLRVILPYLYPAPADWLRWVLLEVGPRLQNVPDTVGYQVAFSLSEAIFGIPEDEVGNVQLMLARHTDRAAQLALDRHLREALGRKLGFFSATDR